MGFSLKVNNLSLYKRLTACLDTKGKDLQAVAKAANSTPSSVTKVLYAIDKGHITPLGKRVIEAIKKLCPRSGLLKSIRS